MLDLYCWKIYVCSINFKHTEIMNNTVKRCLIAQNYSDAAKGLDVYPEDLHYKNIMKIFDKSHDFIEARKRLYYCKTDYIELAIKSAKSEKVSVFYCPLEQCIYFEFSFGQVSFHIDYSFVQKYKNVTVIENYKWSGLTNSRSLLYENYNIN